MIMDIKLLSVYCFTIFIASIIPGPSSLLALSQGARYGVTAGVLSGFGNVIASVLQGILALFAILQLGTISPESLGIIKVVGAAYIVYLGASLLKVKSFGLASESITEKASVTAGRHLWNGFAFAIFNPKAITFFAALFPQFVVREAITAQLLATIFLPIALIAFICFIFYVIAGKAIIGLMSGTKHIGKILGSLIIAAGAILLIS